MKKTTLLISALACLLVQSALAAITVTASPGSQTYTPGGTFNVSLSLTVTGGTPTDIKNFDVIFEGAQTQNGISLAGFAVTGYTPPASRPDWQRVFSGGADNFGSLTTDRTGFLQTSDEGASGSGSSTALTAGFSLGTWTFSVPANATGTFTFDTTVTGTSPSHFSDMFASTGGAMAFSNSASFSIGAIPEPATWSLMGLGGLGVFGLNLLRARRKS